jgi:hypothetical protein
MCENSSSVLGQGTTKNWAQMALLQRCQSTAQNQKFARQSQVLKPLVVIVHEHVALHERLPELFFAFQVLSCGFSR